jgi:hypothetical protein
VDSLTERLRRIDERLAKLRGAGAERFRDAYGVPKHAFELHPPLTEARLRAFEEAHGIALIPEHRAFLARLGNGGAGPGNGLNPLEAWARGPEPAASDRATFLRTPFTDERGDDDGLGGDDECLAFHSAGTMTICDLGGTAFVQLVVSGPEKGRLFTLDIEGHWLAPMHGHGSTFLDWYEAWLDPLFASATARIAAQETELAAYERKLRR